MKQIITFLSYKSLLPLLLVIILFAGQVNVAQAQDVQTDTQEISQPQPKQKHRLILELAFTKVDVNISPWSDYHDAEFRVSESENALTSGRKKRSCVRCAMSDSGNSFRIAYGYNFRNTGSFEIGDGKLNTSIKITDASEKTGLFSGLLGGDDYSITDIHDTYIYNIMYNDFSYLYHFGKNKNIFLRFGYATANVESANGTDEPLKDITVNNGTTVGIGGTINNFYYEIKKYDISMDATFKRVDYQDDTNLEGMRYRLINDFRLISFGFRIPF